MGRKTLSTENIHPSIKNIVGGNEEYTATIIEIEAAIEQKNIVIIGMAQNPYPKKACQLLSDLSIDYHYLEYGSYFSQWHKRGAIKMWSGWQTFPMIFIKGTFIGGYSDLLALKNSGTLNQLLS